MVAFSFFDFSSKYFLQIGDFGIRWYAICILTGIIVGYILGVKEAKKLGIASSYLTDGLLIIVPISIIGARLYYVLFDADKANYQSFRDVIAIWDGGIAIIGAVIAIVISAIIYCKVRKLNILAIFDLIAPSLLVGQILGRWGNWFNGEAHGGIIQSEGLANFYNNIMPWVMKKMDTGFNLGVENNIYYHPTFLYEGLWNLLGLILIVVLRRKFKKIKVGDFIFFYMFWYGLGRSTLIEPIRTDQLMPIFGVPVNILIPALMSALGLIGLILKHTIKRFDTGYYDELVVNAKKNKINTVYSRLEGVLVNPNILLKNAYYETIKKFDHKEVSEAELAKYLKKNYKEVLSGSDKIKFFNEFLIANVNQLEKTYSAKAFYKKLFSKDIQVAIYSNFDLEVMKTFIEYLGLNRYISVFIPNIYNIDDVVKTYPNHNKILLISSKKAELEQVNKNDLFTCLTDSNSKGFEKPEYVDIIAKNYESIVNFMIL